MRIVDAGYGHASEQLLEEMLERPLFAHFATASDDGPRVSPVWFLHEDGALWIIAQDQDSCWKRVARDPRCAIEIVDFDLAAGIVQHVGMRGRASVEPWEPQRCRRLLRRYLGSQEECWDPRFRSTVENFANRWIRFVPETAVVRDQSYAAPGM